MRKQTSICRFFLTALAVFTFGCAPKVSIAPQSGQRLRTVVLLPPSYDVSVTREKLDYINEAFAKKLTNHGFNVISGASLKAFCSDRDCNNPSRLATLTDSDAIAQILVTSTNSANIFAGYFQSISGVGVFQDRSGKEIAKVDYTQTERGGLLFNSGQVLQGIQSTVDKFGENSFNNLTDKFLETIVSKLPSPTGTLEVIDLMVGKSSVTTLGSGRYLACIESNNANGASLRNGKSIIPLRPAGPGKFCGGFILDPSEQDAAKSQWTINLFGRYGESKTSALQQPPIQQCQTQQAVRKEGEKVILSSGINGCDNFNFLVFEAKQPSGPYFLKGKLQKPGNALSLTDKDSTAVAVVGVSDKLGSSKTLVLK